jgi:ABC-2 type transport system permease protein
MFRLLLRARRLAAQNVIKQTWRQRPLAALAMSVAGIGLFVAMYGGFLFFFGFAARLGVYSETVYQAFYYLFLLLLAGAVPFVASTLLQSSDYNLLFAAPIPPRVVVAARLLDATVTNSLQFLVLGVPAIVACATAAELPIIAWPLVVLLIVLFVLLPALLTALALLLSLACFGVGRVRSAITLVNVLMGIGVCITFVLEAHNLPLKLLNGGGGLNAFAPSFNATSHAAHLSPSHWFADALLSLHRHVSVTAVLATFGPLILLIVALFAVCIWLGGLLLSMSNLTEESGGGHMAPPTPYPQRWRALFNVPLGGMIAKDLRFIWRDSMLMSQLAVPLILFAVPFLVSLQNHGLDPATELYPFSAAIIAFILYMQTSILSLSLLGMESQGFWVVLSSPNTRRSFLWAKWMVSTLASGGVAILLTLFAGIVFRAPSTLLAAQIALVIGSAAALSALGIGISAIFPRFLHDNPAMRVSTWALIVGFFASTGYVLATGAIFGLAYFFATNQELAIHSGLIWRSALGLYLVLTLVAIALPLMLGTLRIEQYEWEH